MKWTLRLIVAVVIAAVVLTFGVLKLDWFAGSGLSRSLHQIVDSQTTQTQTAEPTPTEVTDEERQDFNQGLDQILDPENK
ncbi:MAG: hypothetical protein P9M14_02710 [Candidatus Alcyoniella australis]|nr:hypothetical protein [Candidatus Alcyoniella australis]